MIALLGLFGRLNFNLASYCRIAMSYRREMNSNSLGLASVKNPNLAWQMGRFGVYTPPASRVPMRLSELPSTRQHCIARFDM